MFKSARMKLARAVHHIDDLNGQFEAFVERKPHRFSIKHDQQTGQPVIQIRFVEKVPEPFAVVIGDAVHNLRCALDHLMWELIGWDGGTQDKYLQFPCRERKVDFKGACNGIQTPSAWIKDVLAGLECFVGGKGQSLYVIHALDNADKHRAIAPVLRATTHPTFTIYRADGIPIVTMSGNTFIGGHGDAVGIANVPPGGYVELKDDASCPPSIFLPELDFPAGEAFEMLTRFVRAVGTTIAFIENEIAKHPKT